MKKLIALLILGLLGFYVAWPAWSGYRLYSALNSGDEATLAGKIDFPSVRDSMRPAVAAEVDKQFDQQLRQAGGGLGSMLGGDIKKQMLPKLVDGVLQTVITPANVIRIARQGGSVAESVQKILAEQMSKAGGLPGSGGGSGSGGSMPSLPGGLGGLGGAAAKLGLPGMGGGSSEPAKTAPAPATPSAATATDKGKPQFGFSNIKSFGFNGPLGLGLSLAKDPGASKPDLTAVMSFSGFDWKLTKLVPHL